MFIVCHKRVIFKENTGTYILSKKILQTISRNMSFKAIVSTLKTRKSLFYVVVPITTFCFGLSNVYTLKYKLDSRNSEALFFQPNRAEDFDKLKDLRKIKLTGSFDHSLELYLLGQNYRLPTETSSTDNIYNFEANEKGLHVITPFCTKNGITILVDRGWITYNILKPEKRKKSQIKDEVDIFGYVCKLEEKPAFWKSSTQSDMDLNEWLYREIHKMAKYAGTAPFLLELSCESSIKNGPVAGQVDFQNLVSKYFYSVIIWWSLGIMSFIIGILMKKPVL